jgi:hypothetical protein
MFSTDQTAFKGGRRIALRKEQSCRLFMVLHPMGHCESLGYVVGMNLLLLLIVLLLLFGGGGFYLGGPVYGGSGIGLVLLICLIIFLTGGFRTRN